MVYSWLMVQFVCSFIHTVACVLWLSIAVVLVWFSSETVQLSVDFKGYILLWGLVLVSFDIIGLHCETVLQFV